MNSNSPNEKLIDHLFRHQHGKLVAILSRLFGISQLDMIEDVVQDTFFHALKAWRYNLPNEPEAWLTTAAKNRAIDILRKSKKDQLRDSNYSQTFSHDQIDNIFLEHEINDSQLRMIYTACHPLLKPKDQIAFALKTISGLSIKEISNALLTPVDTIKKSLNRARKKIIENHIKFEIPIGEKLASRTHRVHEVIYLIFNEGFHSSNPSILIRKELCGEALRLCKILLNHKTTSNPNTHALFALMCFHVARIDTKIGKDNSFISLKDQNRSKWNPMLINVGNQHMYEAVKTSNFSTFHFEAAIVAEHLKASSYEDTDWSKILYWYQLLYQKQQNDMTLLNIAIVYLEIGDYSNANKLINQIDPKSLNQRAYLYYSLQAEYQYKLHKYKDAVAAIDQALTLVKNSSEKEFLLTKKDTFLKTAEKSKHD